ncbi:unnamed protein product [Cylindrotheca closterium]|uniref:EGF-like domain-containing protein n=1 Tax=Cylindrotheca closterium TaxID=2856 RepID=A0AAD2FJM1_9STRA|nr:unnamed protein product [Cylindrotheca closterium]
MLSTRMTSVDCFLHTTRISFSFCFLWIVSNLFIVSAIPVDVKEYLGIDACSAYLPKAGILASTVQGGIEVIALNSSTSLADCSLEALDWVDPSNPYKRCRTACWYQVAPSKSMKNQCLCLVDPIWMPRSEMNNEKASSSRLLWPCQDDSDCSHNGRCRSDGRCQCSEAWKGPTCGELDLLEVDKTKLGFRQVDDYDGSNISSWGAGILWDETSQLWHGFASEIQNNCGINAWETNSRIVHITGNSPHGPFQKRKVVVPAFSHEPSVVRGPHGEWVMLFSSYRYNATGLDAVLCKSCQGGVTPEISDRCPYQLGNPQNLHHRFQQMMSTAQSPFGPWSPPIEIPQLSTGWDWNTDLTINADGSAVALIRGGTTVYASNYSDPTTWKINGDPKSLPLLLLLLLQHKGWDGASVEDPYIWQQNGVYHALAHAFLPFYGVHAYAPIPPASFDWDSYPLNWTVTGIAYDNLVNFTDGTQHAYARRERPHLVWGPSGKKILALSNGVQFDGKLREHYKDGVFTLVQPVRHLTQRRPISQIIES